MLGGCQKTDFESKCVSVAYRKRELVLGCWKVEQLDLGEHVLIFLGNTPFGSLTTQGLLIIPRVHTRVHAHARFFIY